MALSKCMASGCILLVLQEHDIVSQAICIFLVRACVWLLVGGGKERKIRLVTMGQI